MKATTKYNIGPRQQFQLHVKINSDELNKKREKMPFSMGVSAEMLASKAQFFSLQRMPFKC